MCLILFAHQCHPQLPLVVAANRDEFYQRPSQPAHFWPQAPHVLAGRDQTAGGTWLGTTISGRWAAVTNYREAEPRRPGTRSRGELTRQFLTGTTPAADYAKQVVAQGANFSGFNLLVSDGEQLFYCNNIDNEYQPLAPGIYGLSNHLLDTRWPKVARGKQQLSATMDTITEPGEPQQIRQLSEQLLTLLADDTTAPDHQLPNTGLDKTRERLLSPLFISSAEYGTCCSTVIIQNTAQQLLFRERTFYSEPSKEQLFQIQMI